jgi:MFS family permease
MLMPANLFTNKEKTIIGLAALGGMLEFYDFIIYGIFSIYFAHQFFPSNDKYMVIIQSYLIFISGYIARPVGGIIFSYIGDEFGRKKVLIITIFMMGLASLGIGFLPTYAQWGLAAPMMLLLLRIIQGLAIGGELPSTYVYISETITQRAMAFGLTMSGVNCGLLLGMSINYLLNYLLKKDKLSEFGWRIPFILGGLICFVSYQIRKKLDETAAFRKNHDIPAFPLLYLLKNHLSEFIAGIALVSVMSSLVVSTVIFMPTYLHDILHVDSNRISYLMTFFMMINVLAIYGAGRLAQYVEPYLFLKRLLLFAGMGIPLAYSLLRMDQILFALSILAIIQGASAMITPYVITCLFQSKIRLTGVAMSYNIGFTLFGGLAPLIITYLVSSGYNPYFAPMYYLLMMILICFFGLKKGSSFVELKFVSKRIGNIGD